jgi:hypothetical protein
MFQQILQKAERLPFKEQLHEIFDPQFFIPLWPLIIIVKYVGFNLVEVFA